MKMGDAQQIQNITWLEGLTNTFRQDVFGPASAIICKGKIRSPESLNIFSVINPPWPTG